MNIKVIVVGKTIKKYFNEAEAEYLKRLKRYIKLDYIVIPELKNVKKFTPSQIKEKEAELIEKQITPYDYVVLMDEKGKQKTSVQMSTFLQKKMNEGTKSLCFIVGGAYGFSDEMRIKHKEKLSLSNMTFSHQMIRTFLFEQIYRGLSILKNEPYHNE
jgi:23S rRNA (pseudouridine1915-N3)-methyltransferase